MPQYSLSTEQVKIKFPRREGQNFIESVKNAANSLCKATGEVFRQKSGKCQPNGAKDGRASVGAGVPDGPRRRCLRYDSIPANSQYSPSRFSHEYAEELFWNPSLSRRAVGDAGPYDRALSCAMLLPHAPSVTRRRTGLWSASAKARSSVSMASTLTFGETA